MAMDWQVPEMWDHSSQRLGPWSSTAEAGWLVETPPPVPGVQQVVDFWATLVVKPPSAVTQTTSELQGSFSGRSILTSTLGE